MFQASCISGAIYAKRALPLLVRPELFLMPRPDWPLHRPSRNLPDSYAYTRIMRVMYESFPPSHLPTVPGVGLARWGLSGVWQCCASRQSGRRAVWAAPGSINAMGPRRIPRLAGALGAPRGESVAGTNGAGGGRRQREITHGRLPEVSGGRHPHTLARLLVTGAGVLGLAV